jgi:ribosomal subunit interface protein
VDIVFKGRRTGGVPERFRQQAEVKLAKIEKLDQKVIRIDVEISKERNPRQSGRRERVELTVRHRGPTIRAEAAADDRYAALDLALAKLESRVRRANDRRNARNGDHTSLRLMAPSGSTAPAGPPAAYDGQAVTWPGDGDGAQVPAWDAPAGADGDGGNSADSVDVADRVVPIEMDGDGPLVVREKFHPSRPMTIDQALLEMELVGHDFFLFRDSGCGKPSVVYRRRGYDYGVIRLLEG